MINAIFQGILNVINSLITIICYPVDTLINNAFPDMSSSITTALNSVSQFINNIPGALGFLPVSLITILRLILGIQLTVIVVTGSYKLVVKGWQIIQKIKFW